MKLFKTYAVACALAINLAAAIVLENEHLEDPFDIKIAQVDSDGTIVCDSLDCTSNQLAQTEADSMKKKKKWPSAPTDLDYFGTKDYRNKTAAEKLAELWSVIAPVDSAGNAIAQEPETSAQWRNMFEALKHKGSIPFTHKSDEQKNGVPRLGHAQGIVAKAKWEPVGTGGDFTGIYASGSENVILRLSEAWDLGSWSTGLTPSVALKFLLDGTSSANIHAQASFTPSTSWNFFENPLSSRVQPLDPVADRVLLDTVVAKMVEGTPIPFANAVSVIGDRNNDGQWQKKGTTVSPYELRFDAATDFAIPSSKPEDDTMWYDQVMGAVKAGDTLFKVMAKARPDADWVHIANVSLISDLTTSEFGDNRLFFQKYKANDDQKFWDWEWRTKAQSLETAFSQDPSDGDLWDITVPTGWPIHDSCQAIEKVEAEVALTGNPYTWLFHLDQAVHDTYLLATN